MEECKIAKERQTLIQAFEKLDEACAKLKGVASLTERLNEKLNRTEGHPKCEGDALKKEQETNRNIVELFYLIAEKIEIQINVIGNNTERSINMID